MDIIQRLDAHFDQSGERIFRDASDALFLEKLLSDKLYRALILCLGSKEGPSRDAVTNEALVFYETSRVFEVLPEP
jgi:hypothetical protein